MIAARLAAAAERSAAAIAATQRVKSETQNRNVKYMAAAGEYSAAADFEAGIGSMDNVGIRKCSSYSINASRSWLYHNGKWIQKGEHLADHLFSFYGQMNAR